MIICMQSRMNINRRGISNVVATIILIAVAIALAVAVAVWVFGLAAAQPKQPHSRCRLLV